MIITKSTFKQKLEDVQSGSTKYIYDILQDILDRIAELEKKQPEKVAEKKVEPAPKVTGKK